MSAAPSPLWNEDFGTRVKRDFPLLAGQAIHYLDSGATAQKPQAVIDAMTRFMEHDYANVNRGIYALGARATAAFQAARERVASFIGADPREIVFTSGATESINLVAAGYGRTFIKAEDEIILTALEHHANIVPWVQLAKEVGATIKVVPFAADGSVSASDVEKLITDKTKLIAFAHVSNVLGTVLPVAEIAALARAKNIVTLVDGCQAAAHMKIDVKKLGVDFYAFSSHKIYGPSGIGALYGRYELLEQMPPYQTGGDMIERVTFTDVTFKVPPHRFEAGTPAMTEAVGFAAAIDYLEALGWDNIAAHEARLLKLASEKLAQVEGVTFHGTAVGKESIIAFSVAGVQAYDLATLMDKMNVCVRAGQHCAEPLHDILGVQSTVRASFAVYNTEEDVDALVHAVARAREMLL